MVFEFGPDEIFTGYEEIPALAQEGLKRYVFDRAPTGSFLRAVLENDLTTAATKADAANLPLLKTYSLWLINRAPSGCYGSPEKVAEWLSAAKTK